MKSHIFLILFAGFIILDLNVSAQQEVSVTNPDKLVVVWTSGDPNVAEKVALMYTHAARTSGWFKEVTLVVWGPSAKLISENSKLQEKVKAMQKDGVVVEACIACANLYGVTEDLRN